MSIKQFGSVALMSVLIVSISALLTFIRDQVFAQPQYPGSQQNQQANFPHSSAPQSAAPHSSAMVSIPVVELQQSKWLANFTILEQQGIELITIVNPEAQRIGVYGVDLKDGSIRFRNMRHVNADFQMEVYNGVGPTPQQIEQSLQQYSP